MISKLIIRETTAPLLEDIAAMEGLFFFRDADVEGLRIYQDSVSAIVACIMTQRFGMGMKAMQPYSIFSRCWNEAPDVLIKWRK